MQDRIENTFDDWPDPVILIDPAGTVRHANQPACHLFGYNSGEFTDLKLSALLPSDRGERLAWIKVMYSKDPYGAGYGAGTDLTCVHRDGTIIDARVTFEVAPLHGENWTWALIDPSGKQQETSQNRLRAGDSGGNDQVQDRIRPSIRAGSLWSPRVGELLSTVLRFESTFADVAKALASRIEYDSLGITIVDRNTQVLRSWSDAQTTCDSKPCRRNGDSYPLTGTITEEVIKSRQPQMVKVDTGAVLKKRYPGAIMDPVPYLATIAVPLFDGDEIPGVLFACSRKKDAFRNQHVHILTDVAEVL